VHAQLQAVRKNEERFRGIADVKRRTFAAMLSVMDDNVGVVLSKTRAFGLENDTFIVFISDNGGPTGSRRPATAL
jgi:arylsulfatase A-like enzyme